ncbi:hypothetical protein T10_13286 [Trichinella papuae]|uniref:Uncharacterized protein n=1 Tax=Trichinella papuae TaxID=268474 RepID=A0A0V1MR28_9BILA|nr:hypothetical protein T10_13286 [Trichinella papuae]
MLLISILSPSNLYSNHRQHLLIKHFFRGTVSTLQLVENAVYSRLIINKSERKELFYFQI